MKKISSVLLTLTFSFLSSQESIETDRPDQTESASLTPKKFIQIESGFLYEKTGTQAEKFSHPNILWKYGINDNFELRMITEFSSEKSGNETFSGMMPLTLGFKAKLTDEKKLLPKISFIAHLTANKLSSKHFKPVISHRVSNFCFSTLYLKSGGWDIISAPTGMVKLLMLQRYTLYQRRTASTKNGLHLRKFLDF